MTSKINHGIKHRQKPNDIFLTPPDLALKHIEYIQDLTTEDDIWLDPCRNTGNYYNQIDGHKEYCEILEDKDFFEYDEKIDIIVSNPPYSILDKWFKKSVELEPRVISYLIGINNLTARRIEIMENAGYGLTRMKMLKVYKWFGMSVIVVFEKNKKSVIDFDRTVWK